MEIISSYFDNVLLSRGRFRLNGCGVRVSLEGLDVFSMFTDGIFTSASLSTILGVIRTIFVLEF